MYANTPWMDVTPFLRGPVDLDPVTMLRPGHTFCRVFHGERHEVFVVHPTAVPGAAAKRGWWRYWYRGERYRSLSGLASQITGRRTENGSVFFGFRRRRRKTTCKPKLPQS